VQKDIEVLSIFPELSTIEWRHQTYHFLPSWLPPQSSSKEEKISAATTLLRNSKFQGDKRIVIHHPFKVIAPNGGPPLIPGAAPVPLKEEDGYDEIFKLPQETK
jgi:hypothetical protein